MPAVTARLELDYRAPVLIGAPLTIEAWDETEDGEARKRRQRAVLQDAGGRTLAEATGLFVGVDASHFHNVAGSRPEHWGDGEAPTAWPIPPRSIRGIAGYVPGVCNLNPRGVASRRRGGHVALAASAAALAAEAALRAPWWTGLLVSVPLAGAASGYLQARERFCIAHAVAGTQATGDEYAAVEDEAARHADRAAARALGAKAAACGLAGGAAAAAVLAALG